MLFLRCLVLVLFSFSVSSAEDELSEGIKLFEQGKFDASKSIFESLIQDDNAEAYYYLGLIHDPEFNKVPFSKEHSPYDKANDRLTRKYYKKAANLGYLYANFRLGAYYHSMLLRRQDWKLGDRYFRKAKKELEDPASQGDWMAMYMLAVIYESNKRPYGENALKMLEDSASKGNSKAQLYLGKSLSQFLCRTDKCRDYSKAYAWFVISASSGSYHAKYHLFQLMKIMSEKEVQIGDELVNKILAIK
jgi:TPR repeat protein